MPLYRLDEAVPETPGPGRFWVAPDARVIGRVRLAEDVGIWFGAVLRGDHELIDIGAGTNVQEHTVMHTDDGFPLTIGAGCTIGHRVILHGCTVGEASLIGMGATIMNGARIGRHCVIGAGALVPEGREIPDGMLALGFPAKPVRALSPAEIDGLGRSARHYVENWKRFAAGLATL